MTRASRFVLFASSLLMAAWTVTPTGGLAAAAPAVAGRAQAESQKLNTIFDEYFEAYLQQNPILATSIGDPRYNDRFVVGISPAAIAAEDPPELPPGTRSRSQGLCVGKKAEFSVEEPIANSSMFDLPTMTAPAAKSFSTTCAL